MKNIMIFWILSIILAGCIPIPMPYGPYFEPSYENNSSQIIREGCHGYSGASSGIKFTIENGIVVELKTSYLSGYKSDVKHPFLLTLTLPKGVRVQFVSDKIYISGADGIVNVKMPTTISVGATAHVEANDTLDIHSLSPIALNELLTTGQKPQMGIWFWLRDDKYKGFEPEKLAVEMPKILFNSNQKVVFDPIILSAELNKKEKNYFTRSMYEERQQKYEKCIRETPHLQCKNILEVYQKGFTVQKDDFNITGRASAWNGSIGIGFSDMIDSSLQSWKFSDSSVTLIDIDTGKVQKRELSKLYIHTGNYEVPFTTRINAPTGEMEGYTYIFINGSLGEQLKSDLEIQLPSAIINGKRFDFLPIKLKLRLFDGEFPPFNC